jgi:hypothetical protein
VVLRWALGSEVAPWVRWPLCGSLVGPRRMRGSDVALAWQ